MINYESLMVGILLTLTAATSTGGVLYCENKKSQKANSKVEKITEPNLVSPPEPTVPALNLPLQQEPILQPAEPTLPQDSDTVPERRTDGEVKNDKSYIPVWVSDAWKSGCNTLYDFYNYLQSKGINAYNAVTEYFNKETNSEINPEINPEINRNNAPTHTTVNPNPPGGVAKTQESWGAWGKSKVQDGFNWVKGKIFSKKDEAETGASTGQIPTEVNNAGVPKPTLNICGQTIFERKNSDEEFCEMPVELSPTLNPSHDKNTDVPLQAKYEEKTDKNSEEIPSADPTPDGSKCGIA